MCGSYDLIVGRRDGWRRVPVRIQDEVRKMNMGEKIREMRRTRGISQEKLAERLGVSFQAVSKWERGETAPDTMLIPAIASFFGVSTDELFGFNLYEIEQSVRAICDAAYEFRDRDNATAEAILREGLAKYPGNETLLNNLLYTMDPATRGDEVIYVCRQLIAAAKDDEIRLDAIRILAEAYLTRGDRALAMETVERLPEIYFTKPELKATLFGGDEGFSEAVKERSVSFERVIRMTSLIGDMFTERGELHKAAAEYGFAVALLSAQGNTESPPYTDRDRWAEGVTAELREKLAKVKKQ